MSRLLIFAALVVCVLHAATVLAGPAGARVGLVRRTHSAVACVTNRPHVVHADLTTVDDATVFMLDTVSGLNTVTCDIDGTSLLLCFANGAAQTAFASQLKQYESFVTASDKFDCVRSFNLTGFIMRRVTGFGTDESGCLELQTTPARYDELIQDGTVSIGPDVQASLTSNVCTGDAVQSADGRMSTMGAFQPAGEADKTVCLGVNSDSSCQHAASSLPIYSNQYVNVQCSNCFLGLEATLFAEVKIAHWRLQELAGGLKNIAVNGGFEVAANAHASWSTGVDKTLPIVKTANILSFWVGPVPVRVWVEIPVELKADFSFASSASATVGATAEWNIGGAYVQWDPQNHWRAIGPDPHFSFNPVIQGQAQFNSQGSLTLAPTVTLHVDNLFSTSLALTPTVNMQASGSTASKQLCASLGYDVTLDVSAELDINIGWLNIHEDKTFGPKTLYASGQQSIGHWCVGARD